MVETALARLNWQAKFVHDLHQLLLCVLRPLEAPSLDVILKAPNWRTVFAHPSIIDRQQSQVVAIAVVEPCLSLVGHLHFVARSVPYILNLQHCAYGHDFVSTPEVN